MKVVRDIKITFQSTPQLWLASRETCWCEECRGKNMYGMGKTETLALADLLEQEMEAEDEVPNKVA